MLLQLYQLARHDFWQARPPGALPTLDTVKYLAQQLLHSVWLALGPVLLALCSRSETAAAPISSVAPSDAGRDQLSNAEPGAERTSQGADPDTDLPGTTGRDVFAHFAFLLVKLTAWSRE